MAPTSPVALKAKKDSGKRKRSEKDASKAKVSKGGKAKRSKKNEDDVGSKRQVLSGRKRRTKGHLSKDDLVTNSRGKVVSRKKHEAGKRLYENNEAFQKNALATKQARKSLISRGNRSPSFKEIRTEAEKIKAML